VDLIHHELVNLINMRHPVVQHTKKIDWAGLRVVL
jgi:hypothetical protein